MALETSEEETGEGVGDCPGSWGVDGVGQVLARASWNSGGARQSRAWNRAEGLLSLVCW